MKHIGWIVGGLLGILLIVGGFILIQNQQKITSTGQTESAGLDLLNTVSGWFGG